MHNKRQPIELDTQNDSEDKTGRHNKTSLVNILHIIQEITVKYVHGMRYGKYKKDYITLLER